MDRSLRFPRRRRDMDASRPSCSLDRAMPAIHRRSIGSRTAGWFWSTATAMRHSAFVPGSAPDEGQSWSDEIVIRDDGGVADLGYPRSVVRADGKMVSVYYYNYDADQGALHCGLDFRCRVIPHQIETNSPRGVATGQPAAVLAWPHDADARHRSPPAFVRINSHAKTPPSLQSGALQSR